MKPRDLAYAGIFGAAAILLPMLFHVLHLGHIFMPMYLPLLTLAFFVGPAAAALTAVIIPLLSGLMTGMPPFYPPISPIMAIELGIMSGTLSAVYRYRHYNEWVLLAKVLILGRCLNFGLIYGLSILINLPPKFVAGLSFISGWPGLILMLVVIPPLVRKMQPFIPPSHYEIESAVLEREKKV